MCKDSKYKDMMKHSAPLFINRLWRRIESDCYYNFEDIPADYNQIHEIRILRSGFRSSAYNYLSNNVFYPTDIRSCLTTGKLVDDVKQKLLQLLQDPDEEN
jgi:hypothetical protein